MSTLDNILADTRQKIDGLRAESAEEAREATAIAEKMAEPTDAYRAMEAEERDLLLRLGALRDEMRTARSALDAMAAERDRHIRLGDAAADAADHFEQVTLPHFATLLDGVPPAEALAATGLMVEPPKDAEPMDGPQGNPFHPATDPFDSPCVRGEHARCAGCSECPQGCHPDDVPPAPREPVATPPVPTAPTGELVATSGPLTTMPDPGSAHPVPNPPMPSGSSAWPDPVPNPPLPPAEPTGQARHAAPRDSTGTGRMRAIGEALGLVHRDGQADEQQGDGDA